MACIRIDKVTKTFGGDTIAVSRLSLEVADGRITAIVGPSGSGKTTVLRLIAGLETPDGGDILIAGNSVAGVAPERRGVAMLFQDHSLYPHMTIAQNLAFAANGSAAGSSEARSRIARIVEVLEIERFLARRPHTLSGGQRRRAALAKALVRRCGVHLLDEPLNSLDAPARAELRLRLRRLLESLGSTVLYVTHDQGEAMAVAERICVMADGTVQQVGSASQLLESPANTFVAGFVGTPPMNLIRGRLVEDGGRWSFAFGETAIALAESLSGVARSHGEGPAVLGLRPHLLKIGRADGFAARTGLIEPHGPYNNVHLETPCGQRLVACVEPRTAVACGDPTNVRVDVEGMVLFEDGEFGANLTMS